MSVKLAKKGREYTLEWAEFEELFLNRDVLQFDFKVLDIFHFNHYMALANGKTCSTDHYQALAIGGI